MRLVLVPVVPRHHMFELDCVYFLQPRLLANIEHANLLVVWGFKVGIHPLGTPWSGHGWFECLQTVWGATIKRWRWPSSSLSRPAGSLARQIRGSACTGLSVCPSRRFGWNKPKRGISISSWQNCIRNPKKTRAVASDSSVHVQAAGQISQTSC